MAYSPSAAVLAPLIVAAALLVAPGAMAHIDLLEPEARAHGTGGGPDEPDDNANQKSAPCGQVQNGRTDRVAVYASGETITVRIREEIDHQSYIRISLNPDGDDFPLRPELRIAPADDDPVAEEEAIDADGDADGRLLGVYDDDNSVSGAELSYEVTLPSDLECDSCTLQVIQYMYNRPDPYYYQCADLVIRADAGDAPMAGAAGGSAMPAAGGAAGSSAMAGASGDAQLLDPDADEGGSYNGGGGGGDDGGCALKSGSFGPGHRVSWLSVLGLALAATWRRRRGSPRF